MRGGQRRGAGRVADVVGASSDGRPERCSMHCNAVFFILYLWLLIQGLGQITTISGQQSSVRASERVPPNARNNIPKSVNCCALGARFWPLVEVSRGKAYQEESRQHFSGAARRAC